MITTTFRKWGRRAVIVFSVAAVITAVLLSRNPLVDRRLIELRENGMPTSPEELNHWVASRAPSGENAEAFYLKAKGAYIPFDRSAPLPFSAGLLPAPWRPLSEETTSALKTYVDGNAQAYEWLQRAAEKDYLGFTVDYADRAAAELTYASLLQFAIPLPIFRAIKSSEGGDWVSVTHSLRVALQTLNFADRQPSLFIHRSVIRQRSQLLDHLEWLLQRTPPNTPGLAPLRDAITESLEYNGIRAALIGQRVLGVTTFQSSESERPFPIGWLEAPDYPYQSILPRSIYVRLKKFLMNPGNPHDLAYFLEAMARQISILDSPFPERLALYEAEIERIENDFRVRPTRLYFSRHLLNGLSGLRPVISRDSVELKHVAHLRVARTSLAIYLYLGAKGFLPNELSELVPEFIDELPVDPYSGMLLSYRPEPDAYAVYSFGPDEVDDHRGRPMASFVHGRDPGDDIGFAIRLAPPAPDWITLEP